MGKHKNRLFRRKEKKRQRIKFAKTHRLKQNELCKMTKEQLCQLNLMSNGVCKQQMNDSDEEEDAATQGHFSANVNVVYLSNDLGVHISSMYQSDQTDETLLDEPPLRAPCPMMNVQMNGGKVRKAICDTGSEVSIAADAVVREMIKDGLLKREDIRRIPTENGARWQFFGASHSAVPIVALVKLSLTAGGKTVKGSLFVQSGNCRHDLLLGSNLLPYFGLQLCDERQQKRSPLIHNVSSLMTEMDTTQVPTPVTELIQLQTVADRQLTQYPCVGRVTVNDDILSPTIESIVGSAKLDCPLHKAADDHTILCESKDEESKLPIDVDLKGNVDPMMIAHAVTVGRKRKKKKTKTVRMKMSKTELCSISSCKILPVDEVLDAPISVTTDDCQEQPTDAAIDPKEAMCTALSIEENDLSDQQDDSNGAVMQEKVSQASQTLATNDQCSKCAERENAEHWVGSTERTTAGQDQPSKGRSMPMKRGTRGGRRAKVEHGGQKWRMKGQSNHFSQIQFIPPSFPSRYNRAVPPMPGMRPRFGFNTSQPHYPNARVVHVNPFMPVMQPSYNGQSNPYSMLIYSVPQPILQRYLQWPHRPGEIAMPYFVPLPYGSSFC